MSLFNTGYFFISLFATLIVHEITWTAIFLINWLNDRKSLKSINYTQLQFSNIHKRQYEVNRRHFVIHLVYLLIFVGLLIRELWS